MCGIAGIWYNNNFLEGLSAVKTMTDSLAHRGPDAEGQWATDKGLFLGHRRLAILDLDPRSNQPFHYLNRYSITYNGEVYNYLELKRELQNSGLTFSTSSDTEVICAAFHYWGVACLNKFDGMFAFALYDIKTEQLFCARDRFGEKPFYYALKNANFYFASEMKALWSGGISKEPNNTMIYNYLVHDLVEDPRDNEKTFFNSIKKLRASHYFILKQGEEPEQIRYYSPIADNSFIGSFEEAKEQFVFLLRQSIERRMRSDVPLGSSLSGGLDSSSITQIMSSFKSPNSTFSARFKGFKRDEGVYIDQVSAFCKTKQFNCYPDTENFYKELDSLVYHQEEPFQTGSIFAQYKVYELARANKHIVLLDGQGADELLAGYFNYLLPYYFELNNTSKRVKLQKQLKENQNISLSPTVKQKIQFLYPSLADSLIKIKHRLFSQGKSRIDKDFECQYGQQNMFQKFTDLKENLIYSLTNQGLEKLLRFSDRNAMAHSIEVRLPFLSHELIDFIMTLPSQYFYENGWTKSILRHSMEGQLPNEILWRKDKIGFEAPHDQWVKSPLLSEATKDAHSKLLNNKIISTEYPADFKCLILSRSIYQ